MVADLTENNITERMDDAGASQFDFDVMFFLGFVYIGTSSYL